MQVTDVKVLTHDFVLLGLRFTTDRGIVDADKGSLTKFGILNINIPNRVELIPHGNLLVTQEELDSGINAEDVSADEEALKGVVDALSTEATEVLTKFQKPYEQSLEMFMADENWIPEKVIRTDEHKNQHHMKLPDGTYYRGGWIGSFRSLEKAKRGFHYDQAKWSIHRGNNVYDEALETYPDLKQYKDLIEQIKQTITIENNETTIIKMQVNNETKQFPIGDFYEQPRYIQRGFISEHDLLDTELENTKLLNTFCNVRELTTIALAQAISEFNNKPIINQYYQY
jgi:hypothetical protein